MKEFIASLAQSLVSRPDAVSVTETQDERGTVLELSVAREDVGKVIGRQGRTIRALRIVLNAACAKSGARCFLEIRE